MMEPVAGCPEEGPPQLINAGGELNSMFHWGFGSTEAVIQRQYSVTPADQAPTPAWQIYLGPVTTRISRLPFTMRVSRPSYHMDRPESRAGVFFNGNRHFGLGSYISSDWTIPTSRYCGLWWLKTKNGPKTIGGGQPYHRGSPAWT